MFPSKNLKPLKWMPGLRWHQLRQQPDKQCQLAALLDSYKCWQFGDTCTHSKECVGEGTGAVRGPVLQEGRGGFCRPTWLESCLGKLQVPHVSPNCINHLEAFILRSVPVACEDALQWTSNLSVNVYGYLRSRILSVLAPYLGQSDVRSQPAPPTTHTPVSGFLHCGSSGPIAKGLAVSPKVCSALGRVAWLSSQERLPQGRVDLRGAKCQGKLQILSPSPKSSTRYHLLPPGLSQ